MKKDNLLKGGKTKTGKQTYLFYNKNHKIIEVLPETAEKKGYKPVLKNHDDNKLKELEIKKNNLKKKLNTELSKNDNIDDLNKIQKQELERLKNKKRNKKEDNLDKLEKIEKNYNPSQQEKMKELIDKKEKAEKRQKDFNDKIKKDLEIENKKKEEQERLRKNKEEIQSKIIKNNKVNDSNFNSNEKLKNEEKNVLQEKPKNPTIQDKLNLKSKENFIVKQLFDNPIAKILADYINKNSEFEIFHNNKLIYNSNNTSKEQITLKKDYFEIFDRKYPYTGLRFKKI